MEERFRDDPDAMQAVIHPFNQWMDETRSFNCKNRIYTTPIITRAIVEKAIEELDWVLDRGARVVLVRPAPVPGLRGMRSVSLPEFDPFWARIQAEGVVVTMYASDSSYLRQTNEGEGPSEFRPFAASGFRMYWSAARSPIADGLARTGLPWHPGPLPRTAHRVGGERHPVVRALMESLAGVYEKVPQHLAEEPAEGLRRNAWLSPFWEEDLRSFPDLVPIDHLVFGSDHPHQGLSDPLTCVDHLNHLTDDEIRKVMGGNLAALVD